MLGGHGHLNSNQMRDLINAILRECGKNAGIKVASPSRHDHVVGGGGGGDGGYVGFGGYPSWWGSMWSFLDWVDSIEVGSGGYGEVVGYEIEVVTVTVSDVDEE
ncbi:MAG: hypothetical protein DMF72_03035 [Acidobacteria bacterium]|nr:MAG: hypothetical protein DMF72_03035 [Acidobacteriota bacterium]